MEIIGILGVTRVFEKYYFLFYSKFSFVRSFLLTFLHGGGGVAHYYKSIYY
jgi:hypothetical protein